MTKKLAYLVTFVIVIFGFFTLRSDITDFYKDLSLFLETSFKRSFDYRHLKEFQEENQRLRLELENLKAGITRTETNSLTTFVYSQYPFSDRELLIVDAGEKDGVKKGNAVITKSGFLLGEVQNVKNSQSEVVTIFDPAWKSSVAIGRSRIKAILQGGRTPKLELIPKDAEIAAGDSVFNISPDFPLHQLVGTVLNLDAEEKEPWLSGEIALPYNPQDISEVKIILNFP